MHGSRPTMHCDCKISTHSVRGWTKCERKIKSSVAISESSYFQRLL